MNEIAFRLIELCYGCDRIVVRKIAKSSWVSFYMISRITFSMKESLSDPTSQACNL